MNLRVAFITLVGALIGCSKSESVYVYPGGLFSVTYPAAWRVTFDKVEHMANLMPPDEVGAITISGHDQLSLGEVDQVSYSSKPFGSPVTPRRKLPQLGHDSFVQEFEKENDGGKTRFIALFVFHTEGTLIISGNAPAERFDEKREAFDRILSSIKIRRK